VSVSYRIAEPRDAPALAELLQAYMRETYANPWHGTRERLERDALGAHLNMALAVSGDRAVGFAAWGATYDLHHCFPGIEVVDMFVLPSHRGRGIAVGLLATAAAHGRRAGATFMAGGAVPTGSGNKLYARAAIQHGDKFHLSGRAFRTLAEADPASPRSVLRSLPSKEWNFEA